MLNDNEVKKALESQADRKECIHQRYEQACGLWCELKHIWCEDMSGRSKVNTCTEYKPLSSIVIAKQQLDLINRLQKENERLNKEVENMNNLVVYNATCATKNQQKLFSAKAEAYKEFAERLKEQMYQSSDWSHGEHPFVVEESDIDNTLDELVGEDDE